jgi:hypothetical protein
MVGRWQVSMVGRMFDEGHFIEKACQNDPELLQMT